MLRAVVHSKNHTMTRVANCASYLKREEIGFKEEEKFSALENSFIIFKDDFRVG